MSALALHRRAQGGRASYPAVVLLDNPVAYYRLNEPSGTTAVDSSGNTNNGTYSGAFTLGNAGLLAGTSDTCVNFTGGKMTVPDAAANRLGAGNITLEVWFNASAMPAYASLIDAGSAPASRFYSVFLNAGGGLSTFYEAFGGQTGIDNNTLTSGVLATSTRYHWVITSNGTSVVVYLNGSPVFVRGNAAGASNDSVGVSLFGNPSTGGGLLQGSAQEFAIYNTVLSAARVSAHYNAGI